MYDETLAHELCFVFQVIDPENYEHGKVVGEQHSCDVLSYLHPNVVLGVIYWALVVVSLFVEDLRNDVGEVEPKSDSICDYH